LLHGHTPRASLHRPIQLPDTGSVGCVVRSVATNPSNKHARLRSGVDDRTGELMGKRSILIAAVVTGGAVVGGSAALVSSTASLSASGSPVATTTIPDATTTEIHTLVNQAQRLNTQIANTRAELTRLQQVLATAARRAASRPSLPAVSTVSTGATPTTHATTKASSTGEGDNNNSKGARSDN